MVDLIEQYREAASQHGLAKRAGNASATNDAHDRIILTLKKIDRADQNEDMFQLYDDDDVGVQAWAATHTLEVDEHRAEQKLKEISEMSIPLTSMAARLVLSEWASGALKPRRLIKG
ncbi:MAG: hypothetical protein AAGH68_02705 [Pseudomonadota bacterium]